MATTSCIVFLMFASFLSRTFGNWCGREVRESFKSVIHTSFFTSSGIRPPFSGLRETAMDIKSSTVDLIALPCTLFEDPEEHTDPQSTSLEQSSGPDYLWYDFCSMTNQDSRAYVSPSERHICYFFIHAVLEAQVPSAISFFTQSHGRLFREARNASGTPGRYCGSHRGAMHTDRVGLPTTGAGHEHHLCSDSLPSNPSQYASSSNDISATQSTGETSAQSTGKTSAAAHVQPQPKPQPPSDMKTTTYVRTCSSMEIEFDDYVRTYVYPATPTEESDQEPEFNMDELMAVPQTPPTPTTDHAIDISNVPEAERLMSSLGFGPTARQHRT